MDILELKHRWFTLSESIMGDKTEEIFESLTAKYSETCRHYHTLSHIENCLFEFDKVKDQLSSPVTLELALWFHDVIYDPKKQNNEAMSAKFAKNVLTQATITTQEADSVLGLINATKHPHVARSESENYMMDIDLSILGAEPSSYDIYSSQIRLEYSHVPNLIYRWKRIKVLRSFQALDAIFRTTYFFNLYERSARDNMNREIQQLSNIGPIK
jgi:predicted metal-dependent HD superfamily phosphohydrolase